MSLDDDMAQLIETTRLRILHSLEIFPFVSASMLHQAIGTATPTQLWKPVLQQLVNEGKVSETAHQATTPTGRNQGYTIYHLPCNEYPFKG